MGNRLRRPAWVLVGAVWLLVAPVCPTLAEPEPPAAEAPAPAEPVSPGLEVEAEGDGGAAPEAASAHADPGPPAPATAPGAADPPPASTLAPLDRLAAAFASRTPGEPLADRVARVRTQASRMGMVSAEPAAQGLLLAEPLGSEAERARAAALLAPGLPATWGAVARTSSPFAALPAVARGLVELERNLDASVWWRATASRVLAWALVLGGALFLAVAAARVAPAGAHDLSHRLPGRLPPHAWGAILVVVGLLPALLGEGLMGVAAGAFLIALPWTPLRQRTVLVVAVLSALAGVHPVTDETGRWIEALHADPTTVAIRNAETSGLSSGERDRLARLADRDPAALHALVLWSRRSGRVEEAEQWLARIDPDMPLHAVLLNDAANVRLAAGDEPGAIALYEHAAELGPRAEIYFNLAELYGSRIQLSQQEQALQIAQSLSASTVRELAELRGDGRLAVDLPWPARDLRGRLAGVADGRAVADALRAPFGTGWLVTAPLQAAPVLAALALAVLMLLGRGRIESHACGGCGVRRCEACAPVEGKRCALCGAPQAAVSPLRPYGLQMRRAAHRLVPGLAGLAAGHPWIGWISTVSVVAALAAFALRDGVVPDPLVAGLAGRIAFVLGGALALLVWFVFTSRSARAAS